MFSLHQHSVCSKEDEGESAERIRTSYDFAQPQKVAANGAFTTRFDIPVPPAPNAPAVSLVYDSGSAGGLGGVGWDLSVGWPTLIARDTRFGTPSWTLSSAWVWGASPLVVTDASRAQCELTGACHYRVAPDNLAAVTIRRTQPFQYRGRPLFERT